MQPQTTSNVVVMVHILMYLLIFINQCVQLNVLLTLNEIEAIIFVFSVYLMVWTLLQIHSTIHQYLQRALMGIAL